MFAHNEENSIVRCLRGLPNHLAGGELAVHLIANGCADNTERLVQKHLASHPQVKLLSPARGDKAAAWRYDIREFPNEAQVRFFTRGGVTLVPGLSDKLLDELRVSPLASAATGLPVNVRPEIYWVWAITNAQAAAPRLYTLSKTLAQIEHFNSPIFGSSRAHLL